MKKINYSFLNAVLENLLSDHYSSISIGNGYISFRHVGGDYLSDMDKIVNSIGRFIRAMIIASDPTAYQQTYQKKLMQMIGAPENPASRLASSSHVVQTMRKCIQEIKKEGYPVAIVDICVLHPKEVFSKADVIAGLKLNPKNEDFIDLATSNAKVDFISALQRSGHYLNAGVMAKISAEPIDQTYYFKIAICPTSIFSRYFYPDEMQNSRWRWLPCYKANDYYGAIALFTPSKFTIRTPAAQRFIKYTYEQIKKQMRDYQQNQLTNKT